MGKYMSHNQSLWLVLKHTLTQRLIHTHKDKRPGSKNRKTQQLGKIGPTIDQNKVQNSLTAEEIIHT